jgi:hypothetical protein
VISKLLLKQKLKEAGMPKIKNKWVRPKLIILVRGRDGQQMVLTSCKTADWKTLLRPDGRWLDCVIAHSPLEEYAKCNVLGQS